jgi:hypothetical protein
MQIRFLILPFCELFQIFHHESQQNSILNFERANGKKFYCTPLAFYINQTHNHIITSANFNQVEK